MNNPKIVLANHRLTTSDPKTELVQRVHNHIDHIRILQALQPEAAVGVEVHTPTLNQMMTTRQVLLALSAWMVMFLRAMTSFSVMVLIQAPGAALLLSCEPVFIHKRDW